MVVNVAKEFGLLLLPFYQAYNGSFVQGANLAIENVVVLRAVEAGPPIAIVTGASRGIEMAVTLAADIAGFKVGPVPQGVTSGRFHILCSATLC